MNPLRIAASVIATSTLIAACEAAPPTALDSPHAGGAMSPAFTAGGACAPFGGIVSSTPTYDWIANGTPSSIDCWNAVNTTFVTGTTTCGYSTNALEFGYAGSVYQTFTIPSDYTYGNFSITYSLDFDDPNNDGFNNQFSMEVRDLTANRVLAYQSFFGDQGDLYCSNRQKLWTGNVAGHTLRVRFTGTDTYPDTHIRIRNIVLYQSL